MNTFIVRFRLDGPNPSVYYLCNDNFWRRHPDIGTYPECIKQYRSIGWARRRVKKRDVIDRWEILRLDEWQQMS